MLFDDPSVAFKRDNEAYINSKITMVKVTIEESSNQLYSQQWDRANKLFAASPVSKRHPEVVMVAKDLTLADILLPKYLTVKYAL